MTGWEYLALGLGLWTAVGVVGLTVSAVRREQRKLVQGLVSLVGVWVVYLGVLLAVSARQPVQRVPVGRAVCFDAMCFTVERTEIVEGFGASNQVRDIEQRLARVTVRVVNRGKSAASDEVVAYLRDGQGRVWPESAAVSGNPLDGRVAAGGFILSEPVFKIASDAADLEMVLTHGRWSRHTLVIGDAESLGHRLRVMDLVR